jgi:hypothetical protein
MTASDVKVKFDVPASLRKWPLVLLRYRTERPRRCSAADQTDELAPLHVRTQDQETAS